MRTLFGALNLIQLICVKWNNSVSCELYCYQQEIDSEDHVSYLCHDFLSVSTLLPKQKAEYHMANATKQSTWEIIFLNLIMIDCNVLTSHRLINITAQFDILLVSKTNRKEDCLIISVLHKFIVYSF